MSIKSGIRTAAIMPLGSFIADKNNPEDARLKALIQLSKADPKHLKGNVTEDVQAQTKALRGILKEFTLKDIREDPRFIFRASRTAVEWRSITIRNGRITLEITTEYIEPEFFDPVHGYLLREKMEKWSYFASSLPYFVTRGLQRLAHKVPSKSALMAAGLL